MNPVEYKKFHDKATGEVIKRWRESSGFTQSQLAGKLKMRQGQLSKIEKGTSLFKKSREDLIFALLSSRPEFQRLTEDGKNERKVTELIEFNKIEFNKEVKAKLESLLVNRFDTERVGLGPFPAHDEPIRHAQIAILLAESHDESKKLRVNEADKFIEKAKERWSGLSRQDAPALAHIIGDILLDAGRFEECVTWYEDAQIGFLARYVNTKFQRARAYASLANFDKSLSKDKRQSLLSEALREAEDGKRFAVEHKLPDKILAAYLKTYAEWRYEFMDQRSDPVIEQNFTEAASCYERAARTLKGIEGFEKKSYDIETIRDCAHCFSNAGSCYSVVGEYRNDPQLLRHALPLLKSSFDLRQRLYTRLQENQFSSTKTREQRGLAYIYKLLAINYFRMHEWAIAGWCAEASVNIYRSLVYSGQQLSLEDAEKWLEKVRSQGKGEAHLYSHYFSDSNGPISVSIPKLHSQYIELTKISR